MNFTSRIRRAVPGDEAALALVGQATFLETFAGTLGGQAIVGHCQQAHSAVQYRLWLEDPQHALWLVEVDPDAAPVGFMLLAPPNLPGAHATGDLELKRIYLLGKFQGGGLGKQLIDVAEAHARGVGAQRLLLGVYANNEKALAFYQRAGFVQIQTRRFNVGGVDYDDRVMAKRLFA